MMGRHHARILQSLPRRRLRRRGRPGRRPHTAPCAIPRSSTPTLEALLRGRPARLGRRRAADRGAPPGRPRLAAADVNMLIEKPLAASTDDAELIIAACAGAGCAAAVGHVERFNPALLALREKLGEGQLGDVFLVATERVGPFPERVRDVGVVKDLATHDLDLVSWVARRADRDGGGADRAPHRPPARGSRARHRPPHDRRRRSTRRRLADADEDAPHARARRSRHARRRDAHRRPDLLRERHGHLGLGSSQALRGVTEGNATRYALARREPILGRAGGVPRPRRAATRTRRS